MAGNQHHGGFWSSRWTSFTLLTAGECSADRQQAIASTKIPTVSLHFLCEEQSYHRASYQHDVTGWLEDQSLQKVCHLQVYETAEAQIFSFRPTTAAVRASFQSHLSHFCLLSSGANPRPHPVLTLKGDCSRLEGWEGEMWWAAYL